MSLFLRALLFTFPRFLAILAAVIGLNHLEVSPLPEWTLSAAAYVAHFLITFFFAYGAMRKIFPSWAQIITVTLLFLVGGISWEVGLSAWMTQANVGEILNGFSSESGILVCLYVAAGILAGVCVRQRRLRTVITDPLPVCCGSNNLPQ